MTRKGSARRSLGKQTAVVAQANHPHALQAALEFITPMFGGGVRLHADELKRQIKDPDPVTPVRGASLRGQLRTWWRRACCTGLDLDTMRARESVLWGWASTQNKPAKGLVSIAVDGSGLKRKPVEVYQKNAAGKLTPVGGYGAPLAYGAFPLQPSEKAKKKNANPGTLSDWQGSFTVSLTLAPLAMRQADAQAAWGVRGAQDLSDQLWTELQRAWLAFVTFGGLGGRTRRGFGAVRVVDQSATSLDKAITALGWQERIAKTRATWQGRSGADLAHKKGLEKLRDFRQKPDLGRNPGQQRGRPGRSRWPEPDAIRRATGATQGPHPPEHPVSDRFPRAAFGLPIIFHFIGRGEPNDATLQPQGAERLASPLVIRPVTDPMGDVHAIALWLPTRDDLSQVLSHLELRGTRHRTSGLLSADEQGQIRPLSEHRSAPAAGPSAVYEPFFNFFAS